MDIDDYYHTDIVLGAEGAAYFRSQKAQEYPDDKRNQQSVDALTKLQESLESLPSNHPLVVECYEMEVALPQKLEDKGHSWESLMFECGEKRRGLFSRYGFDGPEDHDAQKFLGDLRDVLKDCSEEVLQSLDLAPSGHA